MKRMIAVLGVLWLAGCSTPTTPEELRNAVDPEVLSSLKNYQELYAAVEQQVRTCYSGANTMRSALYVDEGRGAIGVSSGTEYLALVEVFRSPEGFGSQIMVHTQDDTLPEMIHAWMQGDASCGDGDAVVVSKL